MDQENKNSKEQKMFALLAAHKSSAMSAKDFCALHAISQAGYYYWQKKYNASGQKTAASQSGFTLLHAGPRLVSPGSVLFAKCRGIKLYQQVSADFLKELIS